MAADYRRAACFIASTWTIIRPFLVVHQNLLGRTIGQNILPANLDLTRPQAASVSHETNYAAARQQRRHQAGGQQPVQFLPATAPQQ